ncbi:pentapeptide repeat-containing protein [Actinoplanes xinjiangensis]|uniref:pentapeptide repeat-containing protein n=1 Tax=Actinoplanes xinjiangensis TaxID=512350 RepID=UPI003D15FB0C
MARHSAGRQFRLLRRALLTKARFHRALLIKARFHRALLTKARFRRVRRHRQRRRRHGVLRHRRRYHRHHIVLRHHGALPRRPGRLRWRRPGRLRVPESRVPVARRPRGPHWPTPAVAGPRLRRVARRRTARPWRPEVVRHAPGRTPRRSRRRPTTRSMTARPPPTRVSTRGTSRSTT